MYIVVIAWLYVALMMAITEKTIVAGAFTFLFYGLFPCALFVWIVGTPQRRRNRLRQAQDIASTSSPSLKPELDQSDRRDTEHD
jgi:hypothetical protein